MKKALSLVLALMMLLSVCVVPVMAAEPEGSESNPYYVANPMTAPSLITVPANGAVYYQYNAAVFNGWSVEAYGLSAIIVDGVVYDEMNMWGGLEVAFNFTMMSPGIVGYVNDSAEDVEVMLTHGEPVGTENNPDTLVDGDNALSIPASIMNYVATYMPMANGEYTFSTAQTEGFIITVDADGDFTDGNAVTVENGSITLTLESYISVYVTITPVGVTGDITLTVTPPKAGTEANPIWLDGTSVEESYTLEGTNALYFTVDGNLKGSTLLIGSANGNDLTVLLDGQEYTAVGGALSLPLETDGWSFELVISQAADAANALTFTVDYAEGTQQNPIDLQDGDNAISIPAGVGGYYYGYVAESDGILTITPSKVEGISYLGMADANYNNFAYLQEGKSSVSIPVVSGDVISIELYTAMDEETFEYLPLDLVLNVEMKSALVVNGSFETGDMSGWDVWQSTEISTDAAFSGAYGAHLIGDGGWGGLLSQLIPVVAGETYIVSLDIMANAQGVNVQICDGSDGSAPQLASAWYDKNEWKELSWAVIPTGDYLFINICGGGTGSAESVYVDNVSVELLVPEIANGDFEDLENVVWSFNSGESDTVVDSHSGNWALQLTNPAMYGEAAVQTILVKANTNYTISWWSKRVDGTGAFNLYLLDADTFTNINPLEGKNWMNDMSGEWVYHEVLINTGSTTKLLIKFSSEVDAAGTILIDDMAIALPKVASFDGYLYNGDFETGKTDPYWTVYSGSNVSADAAYEGNYGLHTMNPTGGWGGTAFQDFTVEVGKKYVVNMWAKAIAGGQNIQFQNGGANVASTWFDKAEWTKLSFEFTATDAAVRLNICGGGTNANEEVYFDSIEVVELKESSFDGYIYNGDFEAGSLEHWDVYQGTNLDKVAANSGTYGAHLMGEGTWGAMLEQTFNGLVSGKKYTISFWYKANASGSNWTVKQDGVALEGASGWISANEWTQVSVDFVAAADGAAVLNFCGGGNGVAEDLYVDDIAIREIKDPSFDGYIYNGDFEAGSLIKWDVYQGTVLSKDAAHTGTYGANLKGEGTWGAMLEQTFTGLEAGKTYVISFWYMANASGSNWTVKQNGVVIPVGEGGVSGWISANEWTQVSIEFVAAADGDAVLNFCGGGDGVAEDLYVDDILLVKKESATPEYIPGDVDGNGRVNNRDLGALQQFTNGYGNSINELAGDVDGNGRVNNRDLGLLQQYLNGYNVELKYGKE